MTWEKFRTMINKYLDRGGTVTYTIKNEYHFRVDKEVSDKFVVVADETMEVLLTEMDFELYYNDIISTLEVKYDVGRV